MMIKKAQLIIAKFKRSIEHMTNTKNQQNFYHSMKLNFPIEYLIMTQIPSACEVMHQDGTSNLSINDNVECACAEQSQNY